MKTKAVILILFSMLQLFGATLPSLTETTDPGVGSVMWIVDPNLSDPKDRKITVPNLRTEMGLTTVGAAETLWGVNVIVATEIDTIGEIETLAAGVNILLETEIDASAELKALMDDETGTGGALVFADGPSLSDVVITGSVNIPNGAAPTTDATGELALDTTVTDHKSLLQYDGGADEMLVIAIPRANLDTTDGDVIKYDAASDAFVMSPDNNSGSSTALNDIGDATADGTIAVGAHEIDFTSTIDASGEAVFTITNTDASSANDNSLIDLRRNDADDANSFYLRMIGDNDGTPSNDFLFSQTGFTSRLPGSFGTGNGQIDFGTAGVRITSDGDGAMTWLGLGDGSDEDLTWNLDDVSNSVGVSSSTGVTVIDWGTIGADYDSGTVTLSTVAGAVDFGAATSVELPNGAAPATDATGEIALDTTVTDHKSLIQYDGGADEMLVIAIPRANLDTTDGDVIKYDAATDAFVMSPDNNSGSATAFNDIGDTTGAGSVSIGHTNIWTFTPDGSRFLQVLSSDADNAADTTIFTLAFNAAADANSIFLDLISDADGTPASVFKISATTLTSTLAQTLTGAIDAGGATLEIPNSDDPDVAVAGQISWDTDGWIRGYDGANQVALGRKIEAIHVTVVSPNDLADSERDAFWVWSNESGMSFIVTGWKGWSDTDDTTLNIEEIDADGANNATVDAVEIATNGTGLFSGADTTITAATIENGHLLVLDFDDTDTPGQVKITIYGYYNADVN